MQAKVTVVLLVALISNAAALNCFFCIGSLTSDCFNAVEPSMVIQDCDATLGNATTTIGLRSPISDIERDDPPIVMTCVAFVGTESGTTFIERGCGFIWEGTDICQFVSENIEVSVCTSCDDRDLCNDSPF